MDSKGPMEPPFGISSPKVLSIFLTVDYNIFIINSVN